MESACASVNQSTKQGTEERNSRKKVKAKKKMLTILERLVIGTLELHV